MNALAAILFELISPGRVLFSGEVRAVMLPATEGDMTVMPGHEPTLAMLHPGFAQITGDSVTLLVEPALPPEELTRECLDEVIVHPETMREAMRDDKARREADFAISRLEQVKATLSF